MLGFYTEISYRRNRIWEVCDEHEIHSHSLYLAGGYVFYLDRTGGTVCHC
jgi:hypothetical protein